MHNTLHNIIRLVPKEYTGFTELQGNSLDLQARTKLDPSQNVLNPTWFSC